MSASDDDAAAAGSSSLESVKRCLGFLDEGERRRWAALVPLAVVAAGLEAVGAMLIFALVQVIDDRTRIHEQAVARIAYEVFDFKNETRFVVFFAGAVAVFYVTKNAVLFYHVWVANKRAAVSVSKLSARLLRGYLAAPYPFHFSRNSSELIRNVSSSVEAAFRGVLVAAVSLASETLLTLAVLAVLVATAPGVTLVTSVLMILIFWALLKATHRQFRTWGTRMHELTASILSNLHQSLGGVKEVKVLGRERFFYESFEALRMEASRLLWRRSALEQAPRLFVETLFVLGVTAVIVLFESIGAAGDVVPLLGLFGYAGFRILPSLHRIVFHINSIRFGAISVKEIHDDWSTVLSDEAWEDVEAVAPLPFDRTIALEDVRYRYPTGANDALDGVTLRIERGEAIGIVGATGAGKSTLVDLLLGLLEPTRGAILVDDVDTRNHLRAWQQRIGFVPQSIYLIDDTLRRNIALGVRDERIDEERVREAVRLAQLESFVGTLRSGLDTVVGERGVRLSGGERQRVAVARALYGRPDVLIFDEATSALDNRTERELSRAIEALHGEHTLIIVAHRLTTVRRCDRLVCLEGGRVVDVGSYDELAERSEKFRAMAALKELPREGRVPA